MQNPVELSLVSHVEADWQSSPSLIEKKKKLDVKSYWRRQVIDMYLSHCAVYVCKKLYCHPSLFLKAFQADVFIYIFLSPRQLKLCGSFLLLAENCLLEQCDLAKGNWTTFFSSARAPLSWAWHLLTHPCWPRITEFSLPLLSLLPPPTDGAVNPFLTLRVVRIGPGPCTGLDISGALTDRWAWAHTSS